MRMRALTLFYITYASLRIGYHRMLARGVNSDTLTLPTLCQPRAVKAEIKPWHNSQAIQYFVVLPDHLVKRYFGINKGEKIRSGISRWHRYVF